MDSDTKVNGAGSHIELALVCVEPAMVPRIYPLVSQWIDDAYAVMDIPTPDVERWLIDQKGLLWVAICDDVPVACLTSSLVQARAGLALRMVAAGGHHLAMWKGFHEKIEDYARAEGCYKVTLEGRYGWLRALPGYIPVGVSLEKRI